MTLRAFPYYLLLVAAALFVAIRGYELVRAIYSGREFTQRDYFDMVRIAALVLAAGLAVYRLRRIHNESSDRGDVARSGRAA